MPPGSEGPILTGGMAPHHQSPTSAMEPAGQDLGARKRSGLTTVPLQSRANASPFWIILLLSWGGSEHGMISPQHRLTVRSDQMERNPGSSCAQTSVADC